MSKLLFISIFLLQTISSNCQITNDSCWSLLRLGDYNTLLAHLDNDDFQTYFFRAKINRQKNELEEGIKNIQKALSFFGSDDSSLDYANALSEYAILARKSFLKSQVSIDAIEKCISILKVRSDSTRLADAFQILGNTYINHDTIIGYIDSTLRYYQLSADFYSDKDEYAKALLVYNMGHLYTEQSNFKLAINSFRESSSLFKKSNYIEDFIWSELSIIDIAVINKDIQQVQSKLENIENYKLLDSIPFLKKEVLSCYMDMFKLKGQYAKALDLVDTIDIIRHDIFNAQQQEADAKYNNERLELQLAKEELLSQKRRSTISYLGIILGILTLSFLAYSFIQRQRKALIEQQLRLEKQESLQAERNRIAAEMHDDLGGGLTTIKFVSQSAMRSATSDRDKDLLQKIVNQSNELVSNMSEIIWAMNSKFDTLESSVAYMRRYATTFLTDHQIVFEINVDGDMRDTPLSSTERRNLLLVMKEALNNIAKHAQATLVIVDMQYENSELHISIEDNGIGLDSDNLVGNGLDNMRDRINALGGSIEYRNLEKGTIISMKIELTN